VRGYLSVVSSVDGRFVLRVFSIVSTDIHLESEGLGHTVLLQEVGVVVVVVVVLLPLLQASVAMDHHLYFLQQSHHGAVAHVVL
jgi:hypothetical protein